MISRFLTAFALGAALVVSPAMAQDSETAVAEAPKPLTYAVNADQSVDRENILVLDLSNGGRVMIRLMPEWAHHESDRGQGSRRDAVHHLDQ